MDSLLGEGLGAGFAGRQCLLKWPSFWDWNPLRAMGVSFLHLLFPEHPLEGAPAFQWSFGALL